ncbi:MAG: right-handed parallel beta-helix repeat-containing protein [Bacteroidota bacterium]
MIKQILVLFSVCTLVVAATAQPVPQQREERSLVKGMTINKTTKIKKGIYQLNADNNLEKSIILIQGDNITVDFNNVILKGSKTSSDPDGFKGVGIMILDSKNVTIKNLKAKGYKVALLARNVEGLVLENCDFSYNYRQHLSSTQEKENISDWMSYHHNEKDEWLRYGAAMYLRNCNSATIRNCRVTGGQNALMMMECNDGMIYNNDFSFNSGIGIGMYRCSRNKVMYNKINFNVRGYSHGVYNRGQDSAGILVYEQSNSNFFYKNSATHSGDGFFLWAGQTTMDNGQGGCNDNVIMGNNFSYAPANGVETTFSRNIIDDNRLFECDYGIWGGYSYESNISNNKFKDNRIDIAIEHGQQNKITYNIFYESKEAIKLWSRAEQPANWGYAKYRDTKSRDYVIAFNNFNNCQTVLNANRTNNLNFFSNVFGTYDHLFKIDSSVTDLDTTINQELYNELSVDTTVSIPEVPKPNDPFTGGGKLAGRKNILITEWGPYDFRSPIIWNTNPTDTSDIMRFDLLGPKGKWKIKTFKGVKNISSIKGEFPASITAQKIKGDRTDILIELEYTGSSFTTPFGEMIPVGKTYKFSFSSFFQPIDWTVDWYDYNIDLNTSGLKAFKEEKTNKLDYNWWGGIKTDSLHQKFITIGTGTVSVPKGRYELSVTWDDLISVFVDGKQVINEMNTSLYNFDDSTPEKKVQLQLGGKHVINVKHAELGGFANLSLKLRPIRQ